MDELEILELIKELDLSKTGIGWTITGEENRRDVEKFIRKHFSESKLAKRLAVTEAKTFAYEQIISKSNFAPIIESYAVNKNANESVTKLLEALEHTLELLYECEPPKHLLETYANSIANYKNLLKKTKT